MGQFKTLPAGGALGGQSEWIFRIVYGLRSFTLLNLLSRTQCDSCKKNNNYACNRGCAHRFTLCEVPGIYCLAVHLYLAAGILEGLISAICQTFLDDPEYDSSLSSRLFNPCVYEEIADIFRIFIESCYIS